MGGGGGGVERGGCCNTKNLTLAILISRVEPCPTSFDITKLLTCGFAAVHCRVLLVGSQQAVSTLSALTAGDHGTRLVAGLTDLSSPCLHLHTRVSPLCNVLSVAADQARVTRSVQKILVWERL